MSSNTNRANFDSGAVSQSTNLDILETAPLGIRASRMSRWRMMSLVLVHLLILAHIAHWWATGRTLSPIEPSEAMYTLNDGYLNAGFVFFALALVATLITGRFVCGWGCHIIAYQDLCAWLLKRIGIKPRPFRSRVLVLAPLALALYMFVWPSAYRWWMGIPRPVSTNHLMTTDFWTTFPGPVVTALTVLVCGFLIVYFLGSKGFCTYACPYGGFFRLADKVAPGRIVVSDACEHCGHCTATCTSNVRVHEEVARYGMVVDPGCMKCMDCVSVCPNDALSVGFARPALLAKARSAHSTKRYDFALWEEGLMAVTGLASLLAFRGLYNQIPLLLAMAMAVITSYLILFFLRVLRLPNVRLQNLQLRRGGRHTKSGVMLGLLTLMVIAFTIHSATVQYHIWRGHRLLTSLSIPDEVWAVGNTWWQGATDQEESTLNQAADHLETADRLGLMMTPAALRDQIWLFLAAGRDDQAESAIRRLFERTPDDPDLYRALAEVLRKMGHLAEAESAYRHALGLDPRFALARTGLCAVLLLQDQPNEAIDEYRKAIFLEPDETRWPMDLGRLLLGTGQIDQAQGVLEKLVELDPTLAEAHYNLGMILLQQGKTESAISRLAMATQAGPDFAEAFYNLSVATLMAGRPQDALPHIREAIRLQPDDDQARAFLRVVLDAVGEDQEATIGPD